MLKYLFASSTSNPKLNDKLAAWAAQIIFKKPNDWGMCGTMGIFKADKLIAVIVFHHYFPEYGIVEISAAAQNAAWLTRRTVREIMVNCFEVFGCQQIHSRMAFDNERAIQIYKFLGFDSVALPNLRGSGKHEWLMTLQRDRWAAHRLNK